MRGSQEKIRGDGFAASRIMVSVKILASFAAFLMASDPTMAGPGWDPGCRQVVLVVTPDWASNSGMMKRFESVQGTWKEAGSAVSVTVGHRGLGWGLGLHAPRTAEPIKREGDHRAPAGVFRLEFGFGARDLRSKRFPYYQVGKHDRWIDDPESQFYNQWINLNDPRFPKDWSSAEIMMREDGIYDHVIVVGHNRHPVVPGRGSAIFMHSWYGPGKSTIGCTAMAVREVKALLQWLDPEASPLLVQIPENEISSLALPASLKDQIINSPR